MSGVGAGPHLIVSCVLFSSSTVSHLVSWCRWQVVPKSTLGNWEREFALWAPGLAVVTFAGSLEEREASQAEWYMSDELTGRPLLSPATSVKRGSAAHFQHVAFDVLLTSYETVTLGLNLIKASVAALDAHGGLKEFVARRDRRDVHIDGVAGRGLPPLAKRPPRASSDTTAQSHGAGAGAGQKRKRDPVDASTTTGDFSHLIASATPCGSFESWGVLLVDEGHRLRNSDAVLFETLSCSAFKHARHRIVMTGTPIQVTRRELKQMGEL